MIKKMIEYDASIDNFIPELSEDIGFLNKELLAPFLNKFKLRIPIVIKIPHAVAFPDTIKRLLSDIQYNTQITVKDIGNEKYIGDTFNDLVEFINVSWKKASVETALLLTAPTIKIGLNVYEIDDMDNLGLDIAVPHFDVEVKGLTIIGKETYTGIYVPEIYIPLSSRETKENDSFLKYLQENR